MRIVIKIDLRALVGAAVLATAPLGAGASPHGAGFGGGPAFHGGPGFGGPRGGMGFAEPRGGFGPGRTGFSGGDQRERWFGGRTFAAGRPSFRSAGRTFGGWRSAGSRAALARSGFGRHAGPAFAGNAGSRLGRRRGAPSVGRSAFAANAGRAGRPFGLGLGRAASRFANAPAGFSPRGWNEGFRGFDAWRADRDGDDFGWDGWFWPIGLGFAVDWSLGYPPCPSWGYWGYDWSCWGPPYATAWTGYWGPPYGWGPAYAWDAVYVSGPGFVTGVGYDWDDDWRPAPLAALPPTEYALWSPDEAWSPTYDYADYSPGACVGRRYIWDGDLGAYVRRPAYYPC